ncbi:hypothetical protein ARTHRO9V_280052 [Arthrobacter sp. 9V]|nr:hypothetical protein ARTHRO9V_280052 [Arthrobacter sp. 9V]
MLRAGCASSDPTSGFVGSGTGPGPGHEPAWGFEHDHVGTGLDDDPLGRFEGTPVCRASTSFAVRKGVIASSIRPMRVSIGRVGVDLV